MRRAWKGTPIISLRLVISQQSMQLICLSSSSNSGGKQIFKFKRQRASPALDTRPGERSRSRSP